MRGPLIAFLLTLLGCGKTDVVIAASPDDGGATDAPFGPADDGSVGNPDGGADDSGKPPVALTDKVDLLLAIDNSSSMGDKQLLLSRAVPDLLNRLLHPNCLDAAGNVLGKSSDGLCAQGTVEFHPLRDLHIGIVSSSLGGRGSDVCANDEPVGNGSTRHDDDQGHLLNRASTVTASGADPSEHTNAGMGASNYLAWFPDLPENDGKPAPLGTPATKDESTLVTDFQEAIGGVHEYGCGLEAQLESWYRFLIQPDPYAQIIADPQTSTKRILDGVDEVILRQRHDFLRPDSLVAIIMISDEDDSAVDPRAVGGQGSAYADQRFPGSAGGGAPRGTSACDDPATVDTAACTSCGYPGHASDPNCQLTGDPDQTSQPQPGYYPAHADTLNTRSYRMKQRYGVDPQFPVTRYINGLTSLTVPDRSRELYDGNGTDGQPNDSYDGVNGCTNPLFAAGLPTAYADGVCNLPPGPRSPDRVFFAAITGVPWQLLLDDPADIANSPFARTISPERWKLLTGNDPLHYDYTGIDPHMIQSALPRPGLPDPNSPDTADPYSGREWNTNLADLQYACTFPFETPKDCTDPRSAGACDCEGDPNVNPPLCNGTTQIRGRAYPGIRELTLVRSLPATQAVAASICPRAQDPNNPDFGYRPAVRALVDRFRGYLK